MKNFGNLASSEGGLANENISSRAEAGSLASDGQTDLGRLLCPALDAGIDPTTDLSARVRIVLPRVAATVFFAAYCVLFYLSVSTWWFSPEWTTDDALQQSYPFHKLFEPELFKGDLITEMMERYLTPVHYGITAAMTWVFHDPVMAGHAVMLIQLVLTLGFVFLAVSSACGGVVAGMVPGLFAATWMLHTRLIVQRMTGGLPRGWAAPLLAMFFFFLLRRRHTGVLATLALGCVLHPPVTLICAGAYGLWLGFEYVRSLSHNATARREALRPLLRLLLLAPAYALVTWFVVRMPPEIGTMATLERAAHMPEFSTPDGRFPFYPLKPARWELATFGFQAFASRLYNPGPEVKAAIIPLVLCGCALLLWMGWRRRREIIPVQVLCFAVATLVVYALARALAFQLYVPDRHLQFPLALCFVVGISIAAWRLGWSGVDTRSSPIDVRRTLLQSSWQSYVGLAGVALVVVLGSGSGLQGSANFNYSAHKKGGVFDWIRTHTPPDALIAGEPTLIDGVMLFGKRTAYITTETAHPFYDGYYAAIKPRIETTLRAHYAASLREFLSLVEPVGIDYFVFERKRFYPEALASAKYFEPFNAMLRDLTGRHWKEYAYRELPRESDAQQFPPVPFRDERSVVVDVHALSRWFHEHPEWVGGAEVQSDGSRG